MVVDSAAESQKSSVVAAPRWRHIVRYIPSLALLAVAFIAAFLVFWYADIGDTLDNSVMLAEAIVQGKFLSYYQYASQNAAASTVYTANYNIMLYLVFMIWNLPTVIVHMTTGFDYTQSVPALLWCKALVLASVIAMAVMVRKIVLRFSTRERAWLAAFLTLSSACAFVPTMVVAQYDSIALFLMLLGIDYILQDRRVAAIVAFAFAIPCKTFALFLFVPLILLREKNVLKDLFALVCVMVPMILLVLPFNGDPYYQMAIGTQNRDALDLILESGFSNGGGGLNLFLIGYVITCAWAYCRQTAGFLGDAASECGGILKMGISRHDAYDVLFCASLVFVLLVTLVPIRSYWIILYVPFLVALMVASRRKLATGVLIGTVAGWCGMFYFLVNHWIYHWDGITSTLILKGFQVPSGMELRYGDVQTLLEALGLSTFAPVAWAVFVGCMAFLLIWYRPDANPVPLPERIRRWFGRRTTGEQGQSVGVPEAQGAVMAASEIQDAVMAASEAQDDAVVAAAKSQDAAVVADAEEGPQGILAESEDGGMVEDDMGNRVLLNVLLVLRSLFLVGIVSVMLYASFAVRSTPVYGSHAEGDSIGNEAVLEEEFLSTTNISFSADRKLTEFGIQLSVEDAGRRGRALVAFDLYDTTSNTVAWSGKLGANLIKDGEFNTLKLDGVQVYAADKYSLIITSDQPELRAKTQVYLYTNEDDEPAMYFV